LLLGALLAAMTACHDGGQVREDESWSLDHLFRPGVFEAGRGATPTSVVLSWSAVSGALSYTLEIYSGEMDFSPANLILTDLVEDITYTVELAGDATYTARVKANPDDPSKDSKWNGTVTF
jgi:hypothetical protein